MGLHKVLCDGIYWTHSFLRKEKKDDPKALHVYKYKNGWEKIGTKSTPCSHDKVNIFFWL